MATYTTPLKGKPHCSYEGFDYVLQTIRKDGTENWKCGTASCEARLLRKTSTDGESLTLSKPHTLHIPTLSPSLIHLGLLQLKQLALEKSEDEPQKVITYLREKISETLIACLPSPKEMNDLILSWRRSSDSIQHSASPLVRHSKNSTTETNENMDEKSESSGRKIKIPKKRRKLNTGNDDNDVDMNQSLNRSLQERN